ncbi:deaminase [Legionella pneumophila serogroup 10]
MKHIKKLDKALSSCEDKLIDTILNKGSIKDLIEFLRPVHGEEAAICTAALKGASTKNTTLYCNTYPCHLCTKKIIACGIKRIVYIHPYPKSRAETLYDGIIIDKPEPSDNIEGRVIFESYRGFSPKKYPYVFNLKYKKRYDATTKLIIPREEVAFHPQIIYVSNYTPLGYLLKEKAYSVWLAQHFNTKLSEDEHNDFNKYFMHETTWLAECASSK